MTTKALEKKKSGKGRAKGLSVGSVLRVVTTNKMYGRWCRESLKRIQASGRTRLDILAFDHWEDVELAEPAEKQEVKTVFVSRLGDIPERLPGNACAGKHLLFVEDLPVEAISSRIVRLGVKNDQRLHIARENTPSTISGLLFRVVAGIVQENGPQRIADAWIENGQLVLLAPSFARMTVPIAKLEKFLGNSIEDIAKFEIDEDGSFLYWPYADVHLGWEQFLMLVDPASAFEAKLKTREFSNRYGVAIRSFREECGLRQANIAGLTERHLRRVEKGEIMASKNALEALATAHELTLDVYMKEVAQRLAS